MPVVFLIGDVDYLWNSLEKSGGKKGTDKKDKSRDKFPTFENNSKEQGKTFAETIFFVGFVK